jgi:thiol-disulfide isomerase/thioredoxin
MSRLFSFSACACVSALLCLATLPAISAAATPGEVEVGKVLREAKLDPLAGKPRKLSDFRGKPLIINVWASWCGPCRAEMASLEALSRVDRKQQFRVIGISTDDDINAARKYLRQAGLTFENFIDHKLELENMLGANTIPLTLLVDANGKVLYKARGSKDWMRQEWIGMIQVLFKIKIER